MKESEYRPRIIDRQVDEYLAAFGAVCIEGPKWCGKTWTSVFHSKSEIYIGDPANSFQNRKLAELSPELVLEGDTPRLIDEWQEVPPLWDAVRYKVDQTQQKGQFILTGSATPNHKGILHRAQEELHVCVCARCLFMNPVIPAERYLLMIYVMEH